MRDFRDAKTMAHTLRDALTAKGVKISSSEALELVAKQFGERDWNTLAAAIETAPSAPPQPTAPTSPPRWAEEALVQARASVLTSALQRTLDQALASANERKHEYAALEHLLLALLDDPDAALVLGACGVDAEGLRRALREFIDQELLTWVQVLADPEPARWTAAIHRVIQRSVLAVQSEGRRDVTGANLLVAIFSEYESHAAHFLQQQNMTRYDAINFIAYGIRKAA
jgi:hypothetical protein